MPHRRFPAVMAPGGISNGLLAALPATDLDVLRPELAMVALDQDGEDLALDVDAIAGVPRVERRGFEDVGPGVDRPGDRLLGLLAELAKPAVRLRHHEPVASGVIHAGHRDGGDGNGESER